MTTLREKLEKWAGEPFNDCRQVGRKEMLDLLWPVIAEAQEIKRTMDMAEITDGMSECTFSGTRMYDALAALEAELEGKG